MPTKPKPTAAPSPAAATGAVSSALLAKRPVGRRLPAKKKTPLPKPTAVDTAPATRIPVASIPITPLLPRPAMPARLAGTPTPPAAPRPRRLGRILISIFFVAALLGGVFYAGMLTGKIAAEDEAQNFAQQNLNLSNIGVPQDLSDEVDFRLFWQIWQYVKNNYVQPEVADQDLFYGALAGIVASLGDPYSVFFTPEISEEFAQELSGNFEGIGAEIGIKDNQLQIIAPLSGNPAEKAGLRAGDWVLTIDDEDTRGMALDVAVSKIRGPKGTTVTLSILSADDEQPREVSIVRDTIEIDSVSWRPLDDGIAYIELLYFNENTLNDWNATVREVLAASPTGIILDMRNNPGGFLATAIEVAGEWVNGNTVVIEQSRGGERVEHRARRRAQFAEIPTVVLVNHGSASGSEIVAGALQDYKAATIVGVTTFGKGSVQDLREFRGGSAVKLTIAEWLTPNGRNINREGIMPDQVVELTREDFEAERDPQLDAATAVLAGE